MDDKAEEARITCPGAHKVSHSTSVELQQSDCLAVCFDTVLSLLSSAKGLHPCQIRWSGRREGLVVD